MMFIEHLVIVGVGSIGASVGMGLRRLGLVRRVTGVGRGEKNLKIALQRGAIDDYFLEINSQINTASVILLAVPMGAMRGVLAQIKPFLHADTIITDAGSSKTAVLADVGAIFGDHPCQFVGAHPISGTEKSGAAAAIFDLFDHRRVILTPDAHSTPAAIVLIENMWQALGATVETMSASEHDRILAMTSHLPHMLAYNLVDSLAKCDDVEKMFRYAAGGFRDFTRIASSDPTMWRDICLSNQQAILAALTNYQQDLQLLYQAVADGDAAQLMQIFASAKAARDKFLG